MLGIARSPFSYDYSYDINDREEAVVNCGGSGGGTFLYSSGTLKNLNVLVDPSLGWTIRGAYAINNIGQIAAQARRSTGSAWGAVILNPPGFSEKDLGEPDCKKKAGNPVNIGTGNKYQAETDSLDALSALSITRHYNSRASYEGMFGNNWGVYAAITVLSPTSVRVSRPDQQIIYYYLVGLVWTPDKDIAHKLIKTASGWQLTTSDNEVENYDASGRLLSTAGLDGLVRTFTYSDASTPATVAPAAGLLIRVTDSFDRQLNFTYGPNSRINTITDPAGGLIAYGYDAQSNLVSVTYPDDRLTQTLNADSGIEQYTINALDQTTRVVDPANQATQHTVNALGDVTQTVSADTGTTTRTYDEAGNLKTEKDARNVTVTYTYDALNRLTKKQSSDAATPVYTYFYDTCGQGRLCFVQPSQHLYFNYDPHGRLTYRLSAVPGVSWLSSQYRYDPYGRLDKITYPTNRNVLYSYDAQGRVSQVAFHNPNGILIGRLASNFVHAYPFAGPQSFQYGNGQSFNQSRDQDYRPATAVDGPYQKTYSHDPAGNVASLTDIGNTVLSYSYDSTGRLTGATDTAAGSFGILGYSYDPNGNRLAETRNASILPYVYSPPNWLYQKGSDTRTKTASGNTASSTAIGSFTYDGFNRLATSVTAAETTTYTYNALGERIQKINQNGLSTVFHYGPSGELLFEQDANGNTKVYVWLEGRPLARIDNDAQIYYYHVDHLGTPQAMTNSAGTTVWKADYEPFGKATVKVSTIENNLRFPGQYYDRETGLHYNYFRDYDPQTGRYIEADPIGLWGGLNLYTYVGGNPMSYIDQLGLYTEVIRWATDGSGSGAWGHISGNINGQNFSWGPGGWDSRASAADYIKRQVDGIARNGRGIVLDLTPGEEAKLASCLRRERGSYNGVTNNCGNPWLSCLQELGVVNAKDKTRVLPSDVIKIIGDSPRAIGQTGYSAPGNKSFDIAPIRPIVDSARRAIGH